jgi:hypothetical protein
MKFQHLFVIFVLATITSPAVSQSVSKPILLWPDGAPGATGTSDEDKPAIIPFIPEPSKRNGAAVLVVPGGGFTIRAVDHEGVLVAQWLRDHGITAFLLRYRLRPLYTRTDWVKDGQRGIQYIRSHASEYNISVNRVGAIGFSAGAALITDMALNVIPGQSNATDAFDRYTTRPDFMVLAYGSMRIDDTVDSAVVAKIPPTFMYGTAEDAGSMRGMTALYACLFGAGVPVEAHFFRNGIHGSGFALGDPTLGVWPELMYNWLTIGGFLTDKPQVSISGVVKLDGAPLLKGMLILTPVDVHNTPPVVVYMNNTGTGELGRFSVPQNQGPVAGKNKVEVRQDATRWTSNSRDPFMIEMMEKQRDQKLSEQDKKTWGEYLRKRDLSPSTDKQHIFLRQHPKDTHDYIIDVKEGSDVLIEVFSK